MLDRIKNNPLAQDMIERAVATFLQAFLAVYIVQGSGSGETAGVAGAAAVLSLIKGWLATKVGDPGTAALAAAKGNL